MEIQKKHYRIGHFETAATINNIGIIYKNQLVIRPVPSVRQGWAEAFKKMAEKGDDRLLDENMPTQWDKDEWEWS